ncbi:hypothetical protein [Taibaiella helva]|uniref:hypothetical protein n=1 Tax=Taibaiella helva TaxID=2301235 RepID=UPI000E5969D1|nr:hypothetical protein [Taibaiella helva]
MKKLVLITAIGLLAHTASKAQENRQQPRKDQNKTEMQNDDMKKEKKDSMKKMKKEKKERDHDKMDHSSHQKDKSQYNDTARPR